LKKSPKEKSHATGRKGDLHLQMRLENPLKKVWMGLCFHGPGSRRRTKSVKKKESLQRTRVQSRSRNVAGEPVGRVPRGPTIYRMGDTAEEGDRGFGAGAQTPVRV